MYGYKEISTCFMFLKRRVSPSLHLFNCTPLGPLRFAYTRWGCSCRFNSVANEVLTAFES